jgi:hypothetical protein
LRITFTPGESLTSTSSKPSLSKSPQFELQIDGRKPDGIGVV